MSWSFLNLQCILYTPDTPLPSFPVISSPFFKLHFFTGDGQVEWPTQLEILKNQSVLFKENSLISKFQFIFQFFVQWKFWHPLAGKK